MVSEDLKSVIAAALDGSADKNAALRDLRDFLHQISPQKAQPVDNIRWVPIEKVHANDYNPNAVAKNEMKLLHTSISHDGYCVEETTPILRADLTWVPAGSLVTGDRIIAFDEFATGEGSGRKQRRYRTAYVTSNLVEPSELFLVKTDRGELRVTPDHPFLAKRCYGKGHYEAEWIEAKDLKPSDIVVYLMDPWQVDRSWDAGWLSGFLDGEGTLSVNQTKKRDQQTFRLAGYQRPGVIADRMVAEMTKRACTKVFTVDRTGHAKWSSMVMARIDRLTEVMRLLGSVRPDRLLEKGGEFWEGAALSSKLKGETQAVVQLVAPCDAGNIARLSTSTKTYIANGFAVHNTQPVVTVYDPEHDRYVIVDGFHRYTTMRLHEDVRERCNGLLPIVVIDKDINDRMASTVRHNRARGKHSVSGMASMVFQMLENGWDDAAICAELGLEADELLRLKHVTGFSKLFEDVDYRKAWETQNQIKLRIAHERAAQAARRSSSTGKKVETTSADVDSEYTGKASKLPTNAAIAARQAELTAQFTRVAEKANANLMNVTCPHCAGDFFIDKTTLERSWT
jgi:ParB-like chromosome segregation protein Spo0J